MPLLETLHLIASENPLSKVFFGVPTPSKEHWLLPLDHAAVQQVDWHWVLQMAAGDRFPGFLHVKETGAGNNRVVEIEITCKGERWQGRYSQTKRNTDMGGNALEVRIWPNFCFPVLPKVPAKPLDRIYFFRIRQQPAWRLNPVALARVRDDDGRVQRCELLRLETGSVLPGLPTNFRQANFYFLPAEEARRLDGSVCCGHVEPIGLYFENRGLLLFRFYALPQIGDADGVRWRVGIDVGTSNTCIALLPVGVGIQASPRLGQFEIQTATMHKLPVYEEMPQHDAGMTIEGAAAIFDFPYRYGNELLLNEQYYFPSQFVTRLPSPPGEPDFRFEHGFVFPRNAVLDNVDARELLDGHPPLPEKEYRVFRLVHDVKWSNRPYRKAFLWHLYKMLVIHAARHGARIAEVAFSFPRAFDPDAVEHYKNEIRAIFYHHGGIQVHNRNFMSESIAVQRRFLSEELRADRLVLDVGGGTTDYTGLLVAAVHFQASYCLAAGYVNEYFRASPRLRAMLRDTTYKILGEPLSNKQKDQRTLLNDLLDQLEALHQKTLNDPRIASYNRAAFFGLLGMLNDEQFVELAQKLTDPLSCSQVSECKALRGFFLTLALLYTALAVQGARLFRQHRRHSANVQLDFIGNGSRYLMLLDNQQKPFCRVLERCVQAVWPPAAASERPLEVLTHISLAGKAFVAEGLVLGNDSLMQAEVVPDNDSMRLFSAANAGREMTAVLPCDELGKFVRLLAECMPGGKVKTAAQEEITIIPHCQSDLGEELAPLVRRAIRAARDLARNNAAVFADWQRRAEEMQNINADTAQAQREAAYSVEPVFITCVRCLLDEVRKEYAI